MVRSSVYGCYWRRELKSYLTTMECLLSSFVLRYMYKYYDACNSEDLYRQIVLVQTHSMTLYGKVCILQ